MRSARGEASPSLALIKYWGKQPGSVNVPATTSLAIGLEALRTRTSVRAERESGSRDFTVSIDGVRQESTPFSTTIGHIRDIAGEASHPWTDADLLIESHNNFPTAAGIASSSSGFAALVEALCAFFAVNLSAVKRSSIAREGSGSAARSCFGGFTRFDAGAYAARKIYRADHWSELRLLVAVTDAGAKKVSSRRGMESTRHTSPYYTSWVENSFVLAERAAQCIAERDLEGLGVLMRESYLRMTGSMLGASPPVVYWTPESVALIRVCEELRAAGVAAWETMDAGPQVKILTTSADLPKVREAAARIVDMTFESEVGGEPCGDLDNTQVRTQEEQS